ncbi:unnamed protein product [Cladocopium goreaui]|uniref:Hexosyltransferase n=1 Tax=Cladocopium goreaui TaxID=2562237 RepID=A0A9P1BWM9_9DINO|nr:unnamed protein product [Cladocopium goreaui]
MLCSWLFLLFQPLRAQRQLLGRGLDSGLALTSCETSEDLQLWVDWSLRPPGRAQLLGVQVFSEVEEDVVLIAQLQRHGDLLTLKDVRQVALHEKSDSLQGLLGQRILYGSIDFAMDDKDLLGMIHSCHSRSPSSDPVQPEQRQALAFTLEGELQPGYQVQLSQSDWVMPLAWAFSFEVIEGTAAARAGGAIQILARVLKEAKCFNEDALLKNLRSLSACTWVRSYPTYILHTGKMEGADDQQLLSWMDGIRSTAGIDLRFLDVSEDFERVEVGDSKVKLDEHDLLWLDSTLSNSPEIRKTRPRRHQAGYRHMCRFQTSTVLQLPAFQQMRYLLHLDSDATFRCEGSRSLDPFKEMARRDYVYGLFEVGLEDPGCTIGWSNFLKEWVLLNDLELPNPAAALSTAGKNISQLDTSNDTEKMVEVSLDSLSLTWGTAWEVLDLDFFTSAEVMHFTKRVEGTLGHYRYLWGDHLIRAYQVLLYAPLERVRCFDSDELPGSHGCSGDNQFDSEDAEGEWHNVYGVVDDISCPHLWIESGLKGVEWLGGPGSGTSPTACLKLCNQRPHCQGFDFVYRESSQTADCVLRSGRAEDEECNVGGVEGAAMEPWLQIGGTNLVTKVGAANRYELIEKIVERQMNCSEWREELAEKIRKAEITSLQDLP